MAPRKKGDLLHKLKGVSGASNLFASKPDARDNPPGAKATPAEPVSEAPTPGAPAKPMATPVPKEPVSSYSASSYSRTAEPEIQKRTGGNESMFGHSSPTQDLKAAKEAEKIGKRELAASQKKPTATPRAHATSKKSAAKTKQAGYSSLPLFVPGRGQELEQAPQQTNAAQGAQSYTLAKGYNNIKRDPSVADLDDVSDQVFPGKNINTSLASQQGSNASILEEQLPSTFDQSYQFSDMAKKNQTKRASSATSWDDEDYSPNRRRQATPRKKAKPEAATPIRQAPKGAVADKIPLEEGEAVAKGNPALYASNEARDATEEPFETASPLNAELEPEGQIVENEPNLRIAEPGEYVVWSDFESESDADSDDEEAPEVVREPTPLLDEVLGFKNPRKDFDFYFESQWPKMVKKYGPPGYQVTRERMELKIRKEWPWVDVVERSRCRVLAEESARECEAHNAEARAKMKESVGTV